MRLKGFFTGIICMIIFSGPAFSQYGSFGLTGARQLALGNTYATNSRELYAAGKNPSLMADVRYDRKVSILFPNLSSRSYNVNKFVNFLNDFFSQKPLDIITSLDGSVIKRALESNGKLSLGLQIGYMAVGFKGSEKFGSFSFAMKDYLISYLQLPKTVVRINDTKEKVDNVVGFRDFSFKAQWTRAYEFNYARAFHFNNMNGLRILYTGIGVKYYNGYVFNEIELSSGIGYSSEEKLLLGSFNARVRSAYSEDINLNSLFDPGEELIRHVPFMKPAGKGIGVDLGLTALIGPGMKAGISVTDIGYIAWKGKTRNTLVAGTIDIDSLISEPSIDSIVNSIRIVQERESSFRTSPPTALHVGLGVQIDRFARNFPGEMNLAIEIHQGLNTSGVNLEYPRVAAGLDWKPGRNWPIFLMGITNSTLRGFDWSVGFGYELPFLEIYIASPDLMQYFDNEDLASMSVSLCWHFVKDRKEKIDGSIGKVKEKKKQ